MTDITSDDPADRGTLVVEDRAVSRIVTTAALTVAGVARVTGGKPRLAGRELPRADVFVGREAISVNLYLGVLWPSTLVEVTEAVHRRVEDAVTTMTGLPLHRLNILVAGTVSADRTRAADRDTGLDSTEVVAARPPTASPAAMPVALVFALVLPAVAFVASREFLITHGTLDAEPWVAQAFSFVAGLRLRTWTTVAAVFALVAGLVLLALGVKPRTRTHSTVGGTVWLKPTDIARLCSTAARSARRVDSAHTVVTRRAISVRVECVPGGLDGGEHSAESVAESIAESIAESVRRAVTPTVEAVSVGRRLDVEVSFADSTRVR